MVVINRPRMLQSEPVAAVAVALPTSLRRPGFATTLLHLVLESGGGAWTAVVNRL